MSGSGTERSQLLPSARYVIIDGQDVIQCAKRWLAEKQQTRFRGVRESHCLIVRRSVARQAGDYCRRYPTSHAGGQFSDVALC